MYQLAAFAEQAFAGNPAAVVPLETWIDDALMQSIAAENNLSETAFFVPVGDSEWHIRWFTPAAEVNLCGHATLATAAVIRSRLRHDQWPITLNSASGPLIVDTAGQGFVLDLPTDPPHAVEIPDGLAVALGVAVDELLAGREIYVMPMADQGAVAALRPNFAHLAAVVDYGIVVTAPGAEVDFVSRFFAPALGVDEDPVTGAAHCLLTPYWSARLGKEKLEARQISARGGHLICENQGERVRLQGAAVFFLDGKISV